MRTIRLTIDFTYNPETTHDDEADSIAWFRDDVLGGKCLSLVDFGEIGDVIGSVKVISGHEAIAPTQGET